MNRERGQFVDEDCAHRGDQATDGRRGQRGIHGHAEIHMAGMVQGDVEVIELDRDLAKSKAAAGFHHSAPTFIRSVRSLDGSFHLADGKVPDQNATEKAAEDHAMGRTEFLIAEVVDGEPDDGTKSDQGDAAEAAAGGTEDEREPGDNSGGGIQDIGDAARGEPAGQETVMDVAAVSAKDGLAPEKAPRDGEGGIQKGDGQRNERSGHTEESGGFLGPDDAEAPEEEAYAEASGIAKEDRGWIDIVAEEATEGAGERSGGEREGIIPLHQGCD